MRIGDAQKFARGTLDPARFHLPDHRRGILQFDLRFDRVVQLFASIFRRKPDRPLPAAAARLQDCDRDIDRERLVRGEGDLSALLGSAHRLVDRERDLGLAARFGAVVDDSAEHDLIAHVGEGGHGRFDHDRLVDFEGGLGRAELALFRRRNRDDTITRQAIRRFELGACAALRVGARGRIPKRRRDKVRPKAVERRCAAFTIADEVAFVREIGFRRILLQKRGQSQAGGHAQAARLFEKRERVGSLISGQTKDAFIHRI